MEVVELVAQEGRLLAGVYQLLVEIAQHFLLGFLVAEQVDCEDALVHPLQALEVFCEGWES